MSSTQITRAARAYAAEHGVKYTAALRAVTEGEKVAQADGYPRFVVGQKVRFAEYRTSMIVRAHSDDGRFVALTAKPFGRDTYTVIDFAKGIRGTATSWGCGFVTDEDCEESIAAFVRFDQPRVEGAPLEITSEVSYRNWVWLRYADAQVDPRTTAMLPTLRALTDAAPPRTYNDHNPR